MPGDADRDGYTTEDGDCNDNDAAIHPGASEIAYDGIDQDCTGVDLTDVDGDGADAGEVGGPDCDDTDPDVGPGVAEVPYDGIDQDCNGADVTDVDRDGFDSELVEAGDDCDDMDINTYPGATEFEDDKDNDCDGLVDDGLDSNDDDDDGYTEADGDCDDSNTTVNPGGVDVPYDGIDQDCSGDDVTDVDGDGFDAEVVSGGTDCDDDDLNVHPGAEDEPYDGIDQDCSEGDLTDVDGDGYTSNSINDGTDCNDNNASVHPDAKEIPYNGIDEDCSGKDLTDVDGDGVDSVTVDGGDCNDNNANINPSASEICDTIDNNCNSQIDEGVTNTFYQDADGDTYGSPTTTVSSCTRPSGYVTNNLDCNDASSAVHPGATETCNGVDDDCDKNVDEGLKITFYADTDLDGYGDSASSLQACSPPTGYVTSSTDCNDKDAAVYPGAKETCNGVDDDCDGQVDDGAKATFYADSDNDGYGNPNNSTQACTPPPGYVTNTTDCNDQNAAIHPGASEVCNGVDDDCDLQSDDGVKITFYADTDKDGYGDKANTTQGCTPPSGYVTNSTDCNDQSATVNPGATEVCNGSDDDCDGQADEGVRVTFYADSDLDGYGDKNTSVQGCTPLTGYVTNSTDCDDKNDDIHPGATELCNGVDDDCDAQIDEGAKPTWYLDRDGDNYGGTSTFVSCDAPAGYVSEGGDCNDSDANTYPGATELCQGKDNNCDGVAVPSAALTASTSGATCTGGSVQLLASTLTGATYVWTGPNGYTSVQQNPTLSNLTSSMAGTYTVAAVQQGCALSASTSVSVTTVDASFSAPSVVAVNSQASFTAALAGATYSWSFQSGTPSTATTQTATSSWSAVGTYSVALAVSKAGCSGTSSKTITVSNIFGNCAEIKAANSAATSGVYSIDPDKDGVGAFDVFCEMTQDGGGWTLVMNVNTTDGHRSTLNDPIWTVTTESGSFGNRFTNDYKSLAAQSLPGTQLLLVVRTSTSAESSTPIGWRSWNMASSRKFNDFFSVTMGSASANATGGCNSGYSGDGRKQTNGIKSSGQAAAFDPFTTAATDIYTNSYYGSCGSTQDGFRMSSWYRWDNNSNVGLGLRMDDDDNNGWSLEAGAHLKIETYTNPQRFCYGGCGACTAYPDGSSGYTSTKVPIGTDHSTTNQCSVGVNYRFEWYVK